MLLFYQVFHLPLAFNRFHIYNSNQAPPNPGISEDMPRYEPFEKIIQTSED